MAGYLRRLYCKRLGRIIAGLKKFCLKMQKTQKNTKDITDELGV